MKGIELIAKYRKEMEALQQKIKEQEEGAINEARSSIDKVLSETGFTLYDLYPDLKSGKQVDKVMLKLDDKVYIKVSNATRGVIPKKVKQILDEKGFGALKKAELMDKFDAVKEVPEGVIVVE